MEERSITRKGKMRIAAVIMLAIGGTVFGVERNNQQKTSLDIQNPEEMAESTLSAEISNEIHKEVSLEGDEPSAFEESEVTIGVHVSGAVACPDEIYFLSEGSRVGDAIEAAGGNLDQADLSALNLAEYLVDGEKIYVPTKTETEQEGEWISYPAAGKQQDFEETEKITDLTNINEASKIELMALPGIGESLAERIIAYREENGPFQRTEDIKNVTGIGDSKYEDICDLIKVK